MFSECLAHIHQIPNKFSYAFLIPKPGSTLLKFSFSWDLDVYNFLYL